MGLVDLLPAVSGGTVAYLLGFYSDFLRALSSLIPSRPLYFWLSSVHWAFLIPFSVGWFIAVWLLIRVLDLPGLLQDQSKLLYGLFFGLIGGSVIVFFRRFPRQRLRAWIFLFIGGLIGTWFLLQKPESVPSIWPIYMTAGFLAGGIMLLPGISGSYFLLLIGLYDDALVALAELLPAVLLPLGIGVILGVAFFAKIFSRLLKNDAIVYPMVNGLLLVSMFHLWPFRSENDAMRLPYILSATDWPFLLAVAIGFIVILLCPADRLGR